METIAEAAFFDKQESLFDKLLNWSLAIAAVLQIICLICVGFAASGSRNKGGSNAVRPPNCRCRSRSTTSPGGPSEETVLGPVIGNSAASTRDQRRATSNGSNQSGHGRHHRRRNR